MNLCRNLCKPRDPALVLVPVLPSTNHARAESRPNLELLLAGADVDVRPPDHQSLSRVGLAGNPPVSARLWTQTCETFCFSFFFFSKPSISSDRPVPSGGPPAGPSGPTPGQDAVWPGCRAHRCEGSLPPWSWGSRTWAASSRPPRWDFLWKEIQLKTNKTTRRLLDLIHQPRELGRGLENMDASWAPAGLRMSVAGEVGIGIRSPAEESWPLLLCEGGDVGPSLLAGNTKKAKL